MSSLLKNDQPKQAGSPEKLKFGSWLVNSIYLLTIFGVLAFLYQSVGTSFFGN